MDLIAVIDGFSGKSVSDAGKSDEMIRKLLNMSLLDRLGWIRQTPIKEGLLRMYLDCWSDVKRSECAGTGRVPS